MILISELDRSVNFVSPSGQETRYVRRADDYFIVYLSSHNGCDKSCRFCHLTQTGQTSEIEATVDEMIANAGNVLRHYTQQVEKGLEPVAKKVHFNFMARGEPLSSATLVENWEFLSQTLAMMVRDVGIKEVVFNISTILSESTVFTGGELVFEGELQPVIYYSLYSIDLDFRKRWLPKAMDPRVALGILRDWQQKGAKRKIVLHWALIRDENDSYLDFRDIGNLVRIFGIKASFNLVRYNPYSNAQGEEAAPEKLEYYHQALSTILGSPEGRIVPRAGFDVFASCGTFVNLLKVDNDEP